MPQPRRVPRKVRMGDRVKFWFSVLLVCSCLSAGVASQVYEVMPTVETDPVPHSGDCADDAAIWVHPIDPNLSVIIGTDKDDSGGGLAVYDLSGTELSFVEDGRMNNIDVRYNFPLSTEKVDIIAAGNRSNNSIAVYKIDPDTRRLIEITACPISIGIEEAYGFCLYHSQQTEKFYAFVNDKQGCVEQWYLFDNARGKIDAVRVRRFDVGSQTEGMVADDRLGYLYVGEEDVGIWRYSAAPLDPAGTADRFLVDNTGESGNLAADVEGLTIYYADGEQGYLIASSQGEDDREHPLADTFAVYRRDGNNDYVMSFRIVGNPALGIDAVGDTDGICVSSASLGPRFPYGLFIAQDSPNPGANQNFKIVPWECIAGAASPNLIMNTHRAPR